VTRFATRDCSCTRTTGTGQKRPEECVHGNRFQTPKELEPPKPRKPLARVSAGKKAQGKTSGFSASKAQQDKVRGMACAGCGREASAFLVIDPAHVWPRGKGGCDHPDCVLPLCRRTAGFDCIESADPGCHPLFDEGRLELVERLADSEAWQAEQAHPILIHGVTPVELVRRLTGAAYEFVKVEHLPQQRTAA